MKKKLLVALMVALLAFAPAAVYASDTDLETRVAELEARIADLEKLVTLLTGPGVSAVPDQIEGEAAPIGKSGVGMVANGCTLTYDGFELGQSYDGKDAVVVYFIFTNNSGGTSNAQREFYMEVFQHDREVPYTALSSAEYQAYDDRDTDIRSGADPIRVAFAAEISDTSDIIVNLSAMRDRVDDVEFTLSLE